MTSETFSGREIKLHYGEVNKAIADYIEKHHDPMLIVDTEETPSQDKISGW